MAATFYFKLRDLKLHRLLDFHFSRFTHTLIGQRELVKAVYYIGKMLTDGTLNVQMMHADQQRLFTHLKKHGFFYSLGYLLKTNDVFHEKGLM